jgi:hypothetical protein
MSESFNGSPLRIACAGVARTVAVDQWTFDVSSSNGSGSFSTSSGTVSLGSVVEAPPVALYDKGWRTLVAGSPIEYTISGLKPLAEYRVRLHLCTPVLSQYGISYTFTGNTTVNGSIPDISYYGINTAYAPQQFLAADSNGQILIHVEPYSGKSGLLCGFEVMGSAQGIVLAINDAPSNSNPNKETVSDAPSNTAPTPETLSDSLSNTNPAKETITDAPSNTAPATIPV